jgi:hypothetical protein
MDALRHFNVTTREAPFFFDAAITESFSELFRKAMVLHRLNERSVRERTNPDGTVYAQIGDAQNEILQWVAAENDKMVERFKPYLELKKL